MYKLQISSSTGSYPITIESHSKTSEMQCSALLVDENVNIPERFRGIPLLKLTAQEQTKTLSTVQVIAEFLAANQIGRGAVVGAIGGGVIQDLSTLACSIYMRGISWVFFPTTYTGMVDSCIGGKSSINAGQYKNLLGNFHPPKSISIDLSFLTTLPQEDYVSGVMEAVKILYAKSPRCIESWQGKKALSEYAPEGNGSALLVYESLAAKKWFVEVDEFDKNERLLLNFGHSFGHALEAATSFRIKHGLAVGLGMVAAVHLVDRQEEPETTLLVDLLVPILRAQPSVRNLKQSDIDWQQFEKCISSDKKNSNLMFRLVVPGPKGILELVELPRSKPTLDHIVASMKASLEKVSHEIF